MRQNLTLSGEIIPRVMSLDEFNDMIKLSPTREDIYPIYRTVVDAMERKYSWLGRQVAEELMDSIALSVIDRCYMYPFRVNQHVLLMWDSGWFKSSILSDFLSMMPSAYFGQIGKVTEAALRGTVETTAPPGKRFVSPAVLDYEFLVVKEFGEGITEEPDLKALLLNLLEDQVVNVRLAKFAILDDLERRGVAEIFKHDKFTWVSNTAFSYHSKVTFWSANYNPVSDRALADRFNIVTPQNKLDDNLKNYVMNHPQLEIDESELMGHYQSVGEAIDIVMGVNRPKLPIGIDLTKEFSGIKGITPRLHSTILKKILAGGWWGFWYDSDKIKGIALEKVASRHESQKTKEDEVVEMLKSDWYTLGEISSQLGLSESKIRSILRNVVAERPYVTVRKKDPQDPHRILLKLVENKQGYVGSEVVELPKPKPKTDIEKS